MDVHIGYGFARLSVGYYKNILAIEIEPLLDRHPIGDATGIECHPIGMTRLLIHNEDGLRQLEQIIKITRKELEHAGKDN